MQFYPKNNKTFEVAGWGGGGKGLFNVLSLGKLWCLIKREAHFETRGNFDILLLIPKSKNVISCQFPKILETRIWGHWDGAVGLQSQGP